MTKPLFIFDIDGTLAVMDKEFAACANLSRKPTGLSFKTSFAATDRVVVHTWLSWSR